MSNPISRLFSRTPSAAPSETKAGPEDSGEAATLGRLRAQMEDLKAASQALAAGQPAEFLAKLPQLKRLEVLNAQGQSFEHEFLLEAAGQGCVPVLAALLARGVAATGTGLLRLNGGAGNTALHAAAGQGKIEAARVLLDHGADPNAMNGWGETPLHCAVGQRQPGMVTFLLERGADINARKSGCDSGTPLWRAAEKLDLEGVKQLLAQGADPRLTNPAKKLSPAQGAHKGFEEACRKFHRTHGEERAQLGERIKQYEVLVQLLEAAERRLGPESGKAAPG